MFDDFVLTAAAMKATYAILAVIGLIWLSSRLDQRAGRSFGQSMEEMARDPMALAIYYGARFAGLALLVGLLMGCSAAQAGPVIPSKYDSRIKSAVASYWPDYPAWTAWKAQLYQESRLDPAAVSPVGAAGLAQMMPATWADLTRQMRLGAASPHTEIAIDAGAYYMARLRGQWKRGRTPDQRQPLAQASYNAGTGTIIRAQKLCDGAADWGGISPCLMKVSGPAHARETTTYVARIEQWRRMIDAGL